MAASNCVWFMTLVIASLQMSCGVSLHVEIAPESFLTVIDTEVRVSCFVDADKLIHQIVLMELHKDGEQRPLVVIHEDKATSLNDKLDANRFQASGRIHGDDVSQSSLNLTILNPEAKDAGEYSCVLYYLDEDQLLKNAVEKQNLTALNIDPSTLENYVTKKLADMEKRLIELLKTSGGKNPDPDNTLAKKVTTLDTKINTLDKKVKDQDDKINELSDKDQDTNRRVTRVEMETKNQSKQVDDLAQKVSYTVAFSVTNNHTIVTTSNDDVLVLPDVIMSQGEGYDVTTGIFTAPLSGLYVFHVVIFANSGCDLDLTLRTNDRIMARLQAYDSEHYDQSAISSAMDLTRGDRVYCVLADNGCRMIDNQYTVFTGYLVTPS